jgi:hypothetical protein
MARAKDEGYAVVVKWMKRRGFEVGPGSRFGAETYGQADNLRVCIDPFAGVTIVAFEGQPGRSLVRFSMEVPRNVPVKVALATLKAAYASRW